MDYYKDKQADFCKFLLNSPDEVYHDNPGFRKKSDLLSMRTIYKHQQKQHIKLMSALESVMNQFHELPFHTCIYNNTIVNVFKEKAHEMLWHQFFIHMSPQAIKYNSP